MKLSFGEHVKPKTHNTANMAIDEHAVITLGNEVLKRKLVEGTRVKGCEKLRVVNMEDNTSVHFQDSAAAATQPRTNQ